MTSNAEALFKECSMCGAEWETILAFLEDPDLTLIGYQSMFDGLGNGLFLFNHTCRGTLACYVDQFAEIYSGPIYQEPITGTPGCPGHCLEVENLEPCDNKCKCAYVRDMLQIIKKWPKKASKASAAG